MPAMWDRLRSTTPDFLPHKHRFLPVRDDHLLGSDREKDHWQNLFDSRLDALSVADNPQRFEIRRGKTVPQPHSEQVSPLSDPSKDSEYSFPDRHQRPASWRKPIHIGGDLPSPPAPDSCPQTPSSLLSDIEIDMYSRPILDQISPPSSPDLHALDGFTHDDVSPIDDDDDFDWPPPQLSQQYQQQQQQQQQQQPQQEHSQPQQSQQLQQQQQQQQANYHQTYQPPSSPASPQLNTSPPSSAKASIPSMRRDRRKIQEAAAAAMREAKTKARDKHKQVGHAVGSRNGGVKLNQAPPPDFYEPEPEYGVTTTITSGGPLPKKSSETSFGQRMRQQLGRSKPEPLETRPPWQGASGRSALLQPIKDNLQAPPLNISNAGPRLNKFTGRQELSYSSSVASASPVSPYDAETSGGPVAALRRLLPSGSASRVTQSGSEPTPSQLRGAALTFPSPPYRSSSPALPSPTTTIPQTHSPSQPSLQSHAHPQTHTQTQYYPSQSAANAAAVVAAAAAAASTPASPLPTHDNPATASVPAPAPPAPASIPAPISANSSPLIGSGEFGKAIKRKPPPAASLPIPRHVTKPSTSSSVYSADIDEPCEPIAPADDVSPSSAEQWLQPPSRFSVTTYATSSIESGRISTEEDRPPMPRSTTFSSVMDRTRPIASEFQRESPTDPVVISMHSTYTASPQTMIDEDKAAALGIYHAGPLGADSTNDSDTSTSKALPLAPPELSAADRVGQLNARLESLAYRRVNLNKSIKQMTELMPTDNLLASAEVVRRRDMEKAKVESMKQELSDVQREEYDLGLKLHLAYKRLERDSDYESSSLWVRRVTG